MIRRLAGTERWVLISQVEHARLSGALAGAWGNESFPSLAPHAEMVAAVACHDDGWSAWEISPKVDTQTGRPLDFTETPLTDSLAIWRESISRAEHFGPLAAYMVSGHFSALLERFSGRWKSDVALERLATGFIAEQANERERWLAAWQRSTPQATGRIAAADAVAWLQLFDAMSLWLCCAERSESEEFRSPCGTAFTFQPVAGPYEVAVSPWPFRELRLALEVVGRSIPAARYANASDLVTSPAEPVTLNWSLIPGR
ncbi:MAG TPA: DUF3891 family protein [Pirellulales bacterium]|nr:DUF3891 family protein [Pirellulales bacterium]